MCLPVVFVLGVGLYVNHLREQDKQRTTAYYSHPFEAKLEIAPLAVLDHPYDTIFRVTTNCIVLGGEGDSQWIFSAQIYDVSKKPARQVWSSKTPRVNGLVTNYTSGEYMRSLETDKTRGTFRPKMSCAYEWGFHNFHSSLPIKNCRFVIEAVVMPLASQQRFLGDNLLSVTEVSSAQLAAARKQPGAIYLRKTLDLNARDDAKHTFK